MGEQRETESEGSTDGACAAGCRLNGSWEAENVRLRREIAHAWAAMASRAVIDQATGVIMARTGRDACGAFESLKRASNRSNVKLRDIAAAVLDAAAGNSTALPGNAADHLLTELGPR